MYLLFHSENVRVRGRCCNQTIPNDLILYVFIRMRMSTHIFSFFFHQCRVFKIRIDIQNLLYVIMNAQLRCIISVA